MSPHAVESTCSGGERRPVEKTRERERLGRERVSEGERTDDKCPMPLNGTIVI